MPEALSYTLMSISNGAEGIRETLKLMSGLVKKYKSCQEVRELSTRLTRDLHQKDYLQEVKKLHAFVRDHIRYVKDIRGVETLQSPIQTLRIGAGDCDDKSTLVASLLESLGHPTRFLAVGFKKGVYSHVFVQTKLANNWLSIECTENVPVGWRPQGIKAMLVQHN
jgi:transglutaminase-like putative cysteine protease